MANPRRARVTARSRKQQTPSNPRNPDRRPFRFEELESRHLLSIWLPPGEVPSETRPDAFYPPGSENDADPGVDRFQASDSSRWSSTATNGSGLAQGDPTTLTWGFVADGTWIEGDPDDVELASDSDLIAFLDGIYGNVTPDTDFTDETWFTPFSSYLNRWGELSGLTYAYEPNDDGEDLPSSKDGLLGTRPDLRIGGHSIDGQSGTNTLAYNWYPQWGDMVIDTDNVSFYSDVSGSSLNLRNTLSHEHGHGIGIEHVCPVVGGADGRLMEPYINSAIDGPQFDDILAAQRLYGDALEKSGGNDTTATAHSLGTLALGTPLDIGSDADGVRVASTENDFISIDDNGDTDYFSFTIDSALSVTLLLTPHGPTYLSGPQNSDGTCSAGTSFESAKQSDLSLAIFDTDGTTVLETSNAGGKGDTETITRTLGAGTYFTRITGADNAPQMYELDLSAAPGDFPPTVLSATRDYAAAFPNKLGQLVFQFSEDVNTSAAALSLWNETTTGGLWQRTGGAPYTATLDLVAGDYSLEMRDSYGDGWNEANFTIAALGISFSAIDQWLNNVATTETVTFVVDTAGSYEVLVTAGEYPDEVSWTLTNPDYRIPKDLTGISFNYDASSFQATWNFAAVAGIDAGLYSYMLDANLVTGNSGGPLDGNGNGTGGDHWNSLSHAGSGFLIPKKGDADADGDVDLQDYMALANNFAPTGIGSFFSWQTGDFDEDSDVDLTDYMSLANNIAPTGYTNPIVVSLALPDDMTTVDQLSDATRGGGQVKASGTTSSISLPASSGSADELPALQRRIRLDRTASQQAVFAQYERDRHSLRTASAANLEWSAMDDFARREKERVARLFAEPDSR